MIRISNTLVADYEFISQSDDAVDRPPPVPDEAPDPEDKAAVRAYEAAKKAALDFARAWDLYLDGKGDPPLRQGADPTVFVLRHFGPKERTALMPLASRSQVRLELARAADDRVQMVEAMAEWNAVCVAAFQMALESVRGMGGADGGPPLELEHTTMDGARILTERCLRKFPTELAIEVGGRAIRSLGNHPK